MQKHLHYIPIQNLQKDTVELKELDKLIRTEMSLDNTVIKTFPITEFGKDSDELKVSGSKALLEAFYRIDNVKYDLIYEYKDIKFLGLTEDNEIIFEFEKDDITASGVYEFTNDFYDLFEMRKYAKWLMKHELKDLISENLIKLLDKQKDKKKQFRFIKEGETNFLRGFTSTSYKNYDNNLCIYLILLALHKQSKKNKIDFRIEKAYLSDSAFKIYFEQEKPISIEGLGDVYFGAYAANNEIRDTQFSFEIRYKIVDPRDSNIYFSAMPNLNDSVFEIKKNYKVETIQERFHKINRIKEIQDSMIEYIKELKKVSEITTDELRRLYRKITDSRNFTAGTKSNFTDLYNKNLVQNTYNILQLLNKVYSITTDLDELNYLERIYNEFISEITKSENNKQ